MRVRINGKAFSKSSKTRDYDEAQLKLDLWLEEIEDNSSEGEVKEIPQTNLPVPVQQAQLPQNNNLKHETYQRMQAIIKEAFGDAAKKPKLALNDAFQVYLASPRRRDNDKLTLETKRCKWNKFSRWISANFPMITNVFDINSAVITTWLASLQAIYCGGTYNSNLCVIREMLDVMHKEYGVHFGLFDGVKQKAEDRHTRREFTAAELNRIVDEAIAEGDEYRKLFAIGIYTGLRLGDCCRLMWGNVMMEEGVIQIVPHKTRKHTHGKPVTIPIHHILLSILMETPPEKQVGPVLPTLHDTYLNKRWVLSEGLKRIWKRAGIVTSIFIEGRKNKTSDAGFHSLRHTFVSNACNAGVPIAIVQSIVGHLSSAMTRHYYHENLNGLKQAIAAMPVMNKLTTAAPIIDYGTTIVPEGVPIPNNCIDVTGVTSEEL